jgi:hypothetical protein
LKNHQIVSGPACPGENSDEASRVFVASPAFRASRQESGLNLSRDCIVSNPVQNEGTGVTTDEKKPNSSSVIIDRMQGILEGKGRRSRDNQRGDIAPQRYRHLLFPI